MRDAEVCAEFGIPDIAGVKRYRYGTKYLADIYDQAQVAAGHELVCHVNCDIILMADFGGVCSEWLRRRNDL